jgi:hypothetical protein
MAAHVRRGEPHLGVLTLEPVEPLHRVIQDSTAVDGSQSAAGIRRANGSTPGHLTAPTADRPAVILFSRYLIGYRLELTSGQSAV